PHVPCGVGIAEPPVHGRDVSLLPRDAPWNDDLAVHGVAGDGVPDVGARDLSDPIHGELAVVPVEPPRDLRRLRGERPRPRLREDLEHASANLPRVEVLHRLPLGGGRAGVDVQPPDTIPVVDRLRPVDTLGERDPVELRPANRALRDVEPEERFAVPLRRERVEVARAAVVAIATLNVLRGEVPFRRHRFDPGGGTEVVYLYVPEGLIPPGDSRSNTRTDMPANLGRRGIHVRARRSPTGHRLRGVSGRDLRVDRLV